LQRVGDRCRLANKQGSSGAFAGLLREFETLREFFASATIVALVDVPFILLFLFVIWAIAGPVVLVPLLMVPLVIGSALCRPAGARSHGRRRAGPRLFQTGRDGRNHRRP
jgi:ABC-type bacteriocin/lantibiotic exporter with double-glycine peptidase domain